MRYLEKKLNVHWWHPLDILVAAFFLVPFGALAEKADRSEPIKIEAASNVLDQSTNVLVLEGEVVLEQGTMRITAERMRLKRDAQGKVFAELFGKVGGQITFREKREGYSDYMEGVADRAEFDDKANTLKLFSRARLKNGTDELTGEYIYYNSLTDVIQAFGRVPDGKTDPKATIATGNNRVQMTIQPRQEPSKDAARGNVSSAAPAPTVPAKK
jgi:lipopolysaccharide export system protein LptA